MKPIESAEEFALELADHCEAEYPESGLDCDLPAMASLIEARDNAVRLALLDEIREFAATEPGVLRILEKLRAEHGL